MLPEAGQRFGPYEILGRLGGGGMGLVLRAWDERLHREVAIKMLHDAASMPGMRERFQQEARAASSLNHPNICTIFDIGDHNGDPYLVMELLQGETLKTRIARGALPVADIVRYTEEIADALAVAHAKGIVHRDIKPANVFLVSMPNNRTQAKVLDFGLAMIDLEMRGGWESRTLDLTLAGSTVGTLAYMSPEQARGEALDARSDLFSLGVLIYEMATRRTPFRGATRALFFKQLFDEQPEPVRNWNESVSRDLERVILKLLEKDRRARFETATELRTALAALHRKSTRAWPRRAEPSVPLVRADDPVARRRTPKLQPSTGPASDDTTSSDIATSPTSSSTSNTAACSEKNPSSENLPANLPPTHPATPTGHSAPHPQQGTVRHPILLGLEDFDSPDIQPAHEHDPAESPDLASNPRSPRRTAIVAASILLAATAAVLITRTAIGRLIVLGPQDHLLLTTIENKTGDKTLDGTISQGLELALQQSASLNTFGLAAYQAGLREIHSQTEAVPDPHTAQQIAQKLGARAYLRGEITGPNPPYTISLEVLRADSNKRIAELEERASTRNDLPTAIDRLALSLRREISRDRRADIAAAIPFARAETASIDALHAYAQGEAALENGLTATALHAFQSAVQSDPAFVQAQIRLAWLYHDEKAELASSHAAELARSASAHAGSKLHTLADFCYEANNTGDYPKAAAIIRRYIAQYPHDGDGMKGLARILAAQGFFPESLLATQQGIAEDAYDPEIYNQAEAALLALSHFDSVLQMQSQAERNGILADRSVLPAAYLSGRDEIVAHQVNAITALPSSDDTAANAKLSYATLQEYGRYLDSTGKMSAALDLWKASAAKAETTPELTSAASFMLAQAALDRAIAESCTVALSLVDQLRTMPKGPNATYKTALAAAMCGNQTYADKAIIELQQAFPHNTLVHDFYLPTLHAASDLGVYEPSKSLQQLLATERDDRSVLSPYLRGLARFNLRQTDPALSDFQTVLSRRGASWAVGGTLYPMAEIYLARAYALARDKPDSAESYRKFLTTWPDADRNQPLIREALAKSK